MIITGYYNELGYQVESYDSFTGERIELYRAGNHALESTQDGTGTEHQISLATIKEFCEITTKAIAEEKHAFYSGVECLED